jgi:hypothetical protein
MQDTEPAEDPDPTDYSGESPSPAHDAELAVLCDFFQERGITRVVVRYDGTGDSGSVEDVEYEPGDASFPPEFEKALRAAAENYFPDGYANGEGGYGSLTLYPHLGLAELEHFDRYTDSENMDVRPAPLPEPLSQRLTQLGITSVSANFDGYGDSGQIEELETEPTSVAIDEGLGAELENFLLDQLHGGWEINDGSFGHFTVNVPDGIVEVDGNWRVEKQSEAQVTRWRWRK